MSYTPKEDLDLQGDPTAPTAASGDSDASVATTAFVAAAVSLASGNAAANFLTATQGDARYAQNASAETVTGQWTFSGVLPSGNIAPTGAGHLTSKTYVDSSVATASSNAAASFITATQGDARYAQNASAETITGAWTFSGVLPSANTAPTAVGHLTSKSYVDSSVATASSNAAASFLTATQGDARYAETGSAETVTGVWTFSGVLPSANTAPTAVGHLTSKSYVDSSVATASSNAAASFITATQGDARYAQNASAETITGQWTFSGILPSANITPTTAGQLTTKTYVDSAIAASAGSSSPVITTDFVVDKSAVDADAYITINCDTGNQAYFRVAKESASAWRFGMNTLGQLQIDHTTTGDIAMRMASAGASAGTVDFPTGFMNVGDRALAFNAFINLSTANGRENHLRFQENGNTKWDFYADGNQNYMFLYNGLASANTLRVAESTNVVEFTKLPQYNGNNFAVDGYVTSLPASAVDGTRLSYMTASGQIWEFQYVQSASATFPWVFIGGAPVKSYVNTAQSSTTGSYGDLTTVGPSAVVPFTGSYDITFGSTQRYSGITNNRNMYHGIDVGSAGATDNLAVISSHYNTTNMFMAVGKYDAPRDIASGSLINSQYRGATGDTAEWRQRWLEITPVAVKGG